MLGGMTAQNFVELRRQCGWTQYFAAAVLGVTRSALAHWEQGSAPVPEHVGKALVRVHGRVTSAIRAAA